MLFYINRFCFSYIFISLSLLLGSASSEWYHAGPHGAGYSTSPEHCGKSPQYHCNRQGRGVGAGDAQRLNAEGRSVLQAGEETDPGDRDWD